MGFYDFIQSYFTHSKTSSAPLTVADISAPFIETFHHFDKPSVVMAGNFKTPINEATHPEAYWNAVNEHYKEHNFAFNVLARGQHFAKSILDEDIISYDDEPEPSLDKVKYHRELALAKLEGRVYETVLTKRSHFGDDVSKRTLFKHPYNHKANAIGVMTTDHSNDFVNIIGPAMFLPNDSGVFEAGNCESESSLPKPTFLKRGAIAPSTTEDTKSSLSWGLVTIYPAKNITSFDATRITGLATLFSSKTQVSFTNVSTTTFTYKAFFDEFTIEYPEDSDDGEASNCVGV